MDRLLNAEKLFGSLPTSASESSFFLERTMHVPDLMTVAMLIDEDGCEFVRLVRPGLQGLALEDTQHNGGIVVATEEVIRVCGAEDVRSGLHEVFCTLGRSFCVSVEVLDGHFGLGAIRWGGDLTSVLKALGSAKLTPARTVTNTVYQSVDAEDAAKALCTPLAGGQIADAPLVPPAKRYASTAQ